mgnify:CR=1 FL=1
MLILGDRADLQLHREEAPEGQSLQNLKEKGRQTDRSEGLDGLVVTFARLWDEDHTGLRPGLRDIAKLDAGRKKPAQDLQKVLVLSRLSEDGGEDTVRSWGFERRE